MTVAWSPVFSIQKVRNTLPSFVPPPGYFSNMPWNNTGLDVKPSFYVTGDLSNMFSQWSGREYIPGYSNPGALVAAGGGDTGAGETQQGVFLGDLETKTYKWMCLPTQAWAEAAAGYPNGVFNTFRDPYGYNYALAPDTSVYVPHTYNGCSYVPPGMLGFSKGGYIYPPTGMYFYAMDVTQQLGLYPSSGHIRSVNYYNTQGAPPGTGQFDGSYPYSMTFDTKRNGWWYMPRSGKIVFIDSSLNFHYTNFFSNNYMGGDYFICRYVPGRDLLVFWGESGVQTPNHIFYIWRLGNSDPVNGVFQNSPTFVRFTGTPSSLNAAYDGYRWSTILDCFVAMTIYSMPAPYNPWPVSGTVSTLTLPPAGQETSGGTINWAQQVLQGWDYANKVPQPSLLVDVPNIPIGDFSSLMEIPQWRCFARMQRWDKSPQLFRFPGM